MSQDNSKELEIRRSMRIFLEELRKVLNKKIDQYSDDVDLMILKNLKENGAKNMGTVEDKEVVESEVILNNEKEKKDERKETSPASQDETRLKSV